MGFHPVKNGVVVTLKHSGGGAGKKQLKMPDNAMQAEIEHSVFQPGLVTFSVLCSRETLSTNCN